MVTVTDAAVYLAMSLHELALRSAKSTMEIRGVRVLTCWRRGTVLWAVAALALRDEPRAGPLGWAARTAQRLIQNPCAGTLRSSTCKGPHLLHSP